MSYPLKVVILIKAKRQKDSVTAMAERAWEIQPGSGALERRGGLFTSPKNP